MHIEKLILKNFRGARNLSLELDRRLNVFVGMNGSGKSTVLDATSILLSWLANRIKREGASGRTITETDIRNGESSALLHATGLFENEKFDWNLSRTRKGHTKKESTSHLSELSSVAGRIQMGISGNTESASMPLLVYYPVNRAVLDIPLRIREKHRFDLFAAYDESLTSGANFRMFFEWFREREDLENEAFKSQSPLFSDEGSVQYPDPQLEAVRQALAKLMPEFSNLTVRRHPLRMEVRKNENVLNVSQLSDGEKCLMAMVGDLARRMAIANASKENPLTGKGIVLIDEIDLHLHPLWQRMVVPRFIDVFPECQFLISTHSPHVITHVQAKNVRILDLRNAELAAVSPTESYGQPVEVILENLMGLSTTRPDEIAANLHRIFEMIQDNELDNAKDAIVRLQETIGEDPELIKASVLVKRKELIGK